MLVYQSKILETYENPLEIREVLDYDENQAVGHEANENYDSIFLKYPLNSLKLVYLRFKQIHMNSPFSTIVENHYAGQVISVKEKDRRRRKLQGKTYIDNRQSDNP